MIAKDRKEGTHKLQDRNREDVEGDISVEDRIRDAERDLAQEQEDLPPASHCLDAGN